MWVKIQLSKRELYIIRRLAEGALCKQIAAELGIHKSRMWHLRAMLYAKTQTANSAELVAWAAAHKLLSTQRWATITLKEVRFSCPPEIKRRINLAG